MIVPRAEKESTGSNSLETLAVSLVSELTEAPDPDVGDEEGGKLDKVLLDGGGAELEIDIGELEREKSRFKLGGKLPIWRDCEFGIRSLLFGLLSKSWVNDGWLRWCPFGRILLE